MRKIFTAARASMAGAALMAAVSAANAVPTCVDVGVNCTDSIPAYIQNTGTISADTVLKYCASSASGVILNPLETLLIYPGTAKELSVIPSGGVTLGNANIRDLYIGTSSTATPAALPTRHWKLVQDTVSPEDTYIEVQRTGIPGEISAVAVNGVSNSADVGTDVAIFILFSDNASFDSASVIGYRQALLPPIRRGRPAQTVAAPAGAKSFRLYNTVTLQAQGAKYAIVPHRTGDVVLEAGRAEIRLAYIGVEMDVPQVVMGRYVDIGLNVDTAVKQHEDSSWPLTRVDTAYSGKALPVASADTLYRGTEREVIFSVAPWYSSNVAVSDRGCYWPNNSALYPTMRYWQINTASGRARYIEVNPNAGFGEISRIVLNGTSGSPSVKAMPIVAFSDKLPFDSASIIGIVQDTFPVLRAGGEAAILPAVPAGSKSFRIYHQLIYSSVGGGKWAEDPASTDTLKNSQAVRVAYIGVMHGESAVAKVTVSPASLPSMMTGTQQQFTADVKALGTASPSVTWSVVGAASDQTVITSAGLLSVATGDLETAPSIKVVATSDFDFTVADTAYVTLSSVQPAVNSVTVTPPTVTKLQGDTVRLTATVDAEGGASTEVTWSVAGGEEATGISADGLLTISPNEPATSLTVTATSSYDNTKSTTATVTVTPLPAAVLSVTVSPAAARVEQGESVQFAAAVVNQGGAANGVSWSVAGSSAATAISADGLLAVGATETASMFSVIAASTFDPTVADTATVMVNLPVADDYVDWGVDLINDDHSIYGCSDKKAANTLLAYAKSGHRIRETPPGDTVYAGTEKEMVVRVEGVGDGLIYQSGTGQEAPRFYLKRGATPNHPDNPDYPGEDMSSAHWRLVDGSGFFSMKHFLFCN